MRSVNRYPFTFYLTFTVIRFPLPMVNRLWLMANAG